MHFSAFTDLHPGGSYPVTAEIIEQAHEYIFSSAKNYAGEPGIIKIEILD